MGSTGGHILLFEKDKGLERILTLILKQAGFRVTRFNSVETIVAWLATHTFKGEDILIMDISEADREEELIFTQLRESDSDLPFIILSPYGSEDIDPGKGRPIRYRILNTPFAPDELMGCIEAITERERSNANA